jgi:phosphoribosylglycinamide formyltransferase-1
MQKKRIAIFASGNGTNAMNLIHFFESSKEAEIGFVLSNRTEAGVLEKAKSEGIEVVVVSNELVQEGDSLVAICKERGIDLIVLAGFLRKIPDQLIRNYPNKIVNIHPALLPNYGGKGMYGDHVHQAVLAAGESESGISIHFVNEHFDEGKLLAQFTCPVKISDTLESLRQRVQALEHRHYAEVINEIVKTI